MQQPGLRAQKGGSAFFAGTRKVAPLEAPKSPVPELAEGRLSGERN